MEYIGNQEQVEMMKHMAKLLMFGVDCDATDEMLQEVKEYADYVKFKHSKD